MKKLLSILLVLVLMLSLAACGEKKDVIVDDTEINVESDITETPEVEEEEADVKPEVKPEAKPETKPEAKPEAKPETKPETKPEEKPVEKEEAPAAPSKSTLGNTLLGVFKANASKNAEEIANAIIADSSIKFSPVVVPVEEGLLNGFVNAEIKGFKEGYMFAPMIGSIAFVGYVFDLADGTDANAFVSNLKANANLAWNVCVEADEMVTGVSGNKVFFVMCPEAIEE